jgi:LysM repeat protein
MKRLRLVVLLTLALVLLGSQTVSASSCGGCWYRVQRGDNLYRIALRYHTTVKALATCNGIKNVNRIYTGQYLCVPCNGKDSCKCRAVYTVKRGDNLTRIAMWYGTTVKALVRCNHIRNPNLIYRGQRICIPY